MGVTFVERRNSFWDGSAENPPSVRGRTTSLVHSFTNTEFLGWCFWLLSVVPLAVVQVLSIGPYITYLAKLNSDENMTSLGFHEVPYDSYWSYLTTISILLMAITTLIGGPLADVSPNRKQWLLFTTLLGGCVLPLIIIFLPSTGSFWHLVPLVYLPSTALTNLSGVIWSSYIVEMIPESQRALRIAQSFLLSAVGFVMFGGLAVAIEQMHDPCTDTEEAETAGEWRDRLMAPRPRVCIRGACVCEGRECVRGVCA